MSEQKPPTRSFSEVTRAGSAKELLESLDADTLVVYSPVSLSMTKINKLNARAIDYHALGKNIRVLDKFCLKYRYDTIVGFGGGSAIDTAKYLASKMGARYICIPSMLSTNAYATNKAALMIDGKKITVSACMADIIIYDESILNMTQEQNLLGIADVLSIHTALFDWNLANKHTGELVDAAVYNETKNLIYDLRSYINNNIYYSPYKLYEYIGHSGRITNEYGSGRPESGSEHIFARELERLVEVPHGISVSIGIIVMSLIQNNEAKDISTTIRKLGILCNFVGYGITRELITTIIAGLSPRGDRYSVVDTELFRRINTSDIVDGLIKLSGEHDVNN